MQVQRKEQEKLRERLRLAANRDNIGEVEFLLGPCCRVPPDATLGDVAVGSFLCRCSYNFEYRLVHRLLKAGAAVDPAAEYWWRGVSGSRNNNGREAYWSSAMDFFMNRMRYEWPPFLGDVMVHWCGLAHSIREGRTTLEKVLESPIHMDRTKTFVLLKLAELNQAEGNNDL